MATDSSQQIGQQVYSGCAQALESFAARCQCKAISVVDTAGSVIAQAGDMTTREMAVLSTLAAANYLAALEIARLIGENENFTVHFHQGQHYNFYLSLLAGETLLLIVFDNSIDPDCLEQTISTTRNELTHLLENFRPGLAEHLKEHQLIEDSAFADELLSRLDKVLHHKE